MAVKRFHGAGVIHGTGGIITAWLEIESLISCVCNSFFHLGMSEALLCSRSIYLEKDSHWSRLNALKGQSGLSLIVN